MNGPPGMHAMPLGTGSRHGSAFVPSGATATSAFASRFLSTALVAELAELAELAEPADPAGLESAELAASRFASTSLFGAPSPAPVAASGSVGAGSLATGALELRASQANERTTTIEPRDRIPRAEGSHTAPVLRESPDQKTATSGRSEPLTPSIATASGHGRARGVPRER